MTFALVPPLDLAIATEVAMIVAGLWLARLARGAIRDIEAAGDWPAA